MDKYGFNDRSTTWCRGGVILILEDDPTRVEQFRAVLKEIVPGAEVMVWRSARVMVQEVEKYLGRAALISLDHDLYARAGEMNDPGDGLEAAKFLALRRPTCPVLIHSSNVDRARRMEGEFELEQCWCRTVAPHGPDWVEAYWAKIVGELLAENKAADGIGGAEGAHTPPTKVV